MAINLTIELSKKKNFWQQVDVMMRWLSANFPDDMKEFQRLAQRSRDTAINKFSSNKAKDIRNLGNVPTPISRLINKHYGADDKLRVYQEFFRRYPAFSHAEKI